MRASLVDLGASARPPVLALRALALVAIFTAGCDLGGGTAGELGNGRFFYTCTAPDDVFCSELNPERGALTGFDLTEPPEVPESVVIGSRFTLDFDAETTEDGTLAVDVECAIETFEDQTGFHTTREGWVGFVAERSDGSIVDLIHVLVATPERVDIATAGLTAGDSLAIAGPTDVAAIPYGAGGQILSGGFEATWESSDEEVLRIDSPSQAGSPARGGLARFVPVGTGDALVTVTVAGVARQFTVGATDGELP